MNKKMNNSSSKFGIKLKPFQDILSQAPKMLCMMCCCCCCCN